MNSQSLRTNFGIPPQAKAHYGGKWTLEEEEYFRALRDEFRAGTLDIPNGTTLRCFMAEKLGCKPKRITKKFENTGYNGKLPYVKAADGSIPQNEIEIRRAKLEVLELKFRKSRETLVAMSGPKATKRSAPMEVVDVAGASTGIPFSALARSATIADGGISSRLEYLRSLQQASFLGGGSFLERSAETLLPSFPVPNGVLPQQVRPESLSDSMLRSLIRTQELNRQTQAETELIQRLTLQRQDARLRASLLSHRPSPFTSLLSERPQLLGLGTASATTPILTSALDITAMNLLPPGRAAKRARTF